MIITQDEIRVTASNPEQVMWPITMGRFGVNRGLAAYRTECCDE